MSVKGAPGWIYSLTITVYPCDGARRTRFVIASGVKNLHVKQVVGTVATVLFDISHNDSEQAPQQTREAVSTVVHARIDYQTLNVRWCIICLGYYAIGSSLRFYSRNLVLVNFIRIYQGCRTWYFINAQVTGYIKDCRHGNFRFS